MKDVKICDYLWFQEGPGVRNTQYTTSGVKLINVANLVDGEVDISTSDRFISEEEAYGKYSHFMADEGDFVIASSGIKIDYFEKKMGFIKKEHLPLCMNTSCIRFKVNDSSKLDIKYFMYYLKSNSFKTQLFNQITGSAQLNFGPSHLKKMTFPIIEIDKQHEIVAKLEKTKQIINSTKALLEKYDILIKSRFIEMFGDPVTNSKNLPINLLGNLCNLKAGKSINAKELSSVADEEHEYPCFGGNGIRGFIAKKSHHGKYVLIGRQGALCGNVQLTDGDFYATEHAVVTNPITEQNPTWLYYCLYLLDLNRFKTGAAQPGLTVERLNKVEVIKTEIKQQEDFATFVQQIDKSKFEIENTRILDYNISHQLSFLSNRR